MASSSGDILALHSRSDHPSSADGSARAARDRNAEAMVPPTQPTRSYQSLLILAGVVMTFHVFGINSIYGLFQVSALPLERESRLYDLVRSSGILHLSTDKHSRGPRPGFPGVSRRVHRERPDLEW